MRSAEATSWLRCHGRAMRNGSPMSVLVWMWARCGAPEPSGVHGAKGSVALGDARVRGRQWWDAPISCSSGTRSPEFGVRRVPVPSRDHRPRGALVPPLRALLPRCGRATRRASDRGRPLDCLPLGAALHAAARRCSPAVPPRRCGRWYVDVESLNMRTPPKPGSGFHVVSGGRYGTRTHDLCRVKALPRLPPPARTRGNVL